MSHFTTAFQLVYLAGALGCFGLLAVLTRARGRRILGALGSVLVFTALSAPIDYLGRSAGLWFYPSCVDPPHPPLLVYLGQALFFVGGVALLAWRVQRRWGPRGLVAFAVFVCLAGLGRDLALAALFPAMIRFGPSPAAELADVAAWLVVVLVPVGVTRLIAGPTSPV